MITDRDELESAWADVLTDLYQGEAAGIVIGKISFGAALSWLSEQGLALVPLEPTEDMVSDGHTAWTLDDEDVVRTLIRAGSRAGNLLKKEKV